MAAKHTDWNEPQQDGVVKNKNKCRGNRKLQNFKRKCRARGLIQEQISTMINKRTHAISEPFHTDRVIPEQIHAANKRKRDDLVSTQKSLNDSVKSISQLSISQVAVAKKPKHATT